MSHIIEICNTLPVFSEKRLVVVEDIDKFKKTNHLDTYIESPCMSTILIINSDSRKFKKIKLNAKFGVEVTFYALKESELIDWVIENVEKNNKKISIEAARFLVSLCNDSILEINNELEKLYLFCHSKHEINIEDIQKLIGDIKGYNIFKLIDSILSARLELSLKILKKLVDSGEKMFSIFAMLNSSIHEIFLIKYYMEEKKMTSNEVIKKISINPFFRFHINFYFRSKVILIFIKEIFRFIETYKDNFSSIIFCK